MAEDGNDRSYPERLAFDARLTELVGPLKLFCLKLTRSQDTANNLAQEALCRALEFRDQFVVRTNLSADLGGWLYAIARNAWYADYRLLKMQKRLLEEKLIGGILTTTADIGLSVENKEEFHRLLHCIGSLSRDQREALLAVSYDEMSYKDAAKQLGCPVGTIKSRINRSRYKLRQLMEN